MGFFRCGFVVGLGGGVYKGGLERFGKGWGGDPEGLGKGWGGVGQAIGKGLGRVGGALGFPYSRGNKRAVS